jgi:hypothetical protein
LGTSLDPEDVNFGETVIFTLTGPVYSRNGNLVDCPPILSIGNVLDDSGADVSSDFTFSLSGTDLSISTSEDYIG